MTGYQAFVLYLALKAHFKQKTYDFFKYNKKVSTSVEKYNNRRDKHYFEKLAKRQDVVGYLVSNFICNQDFWAGEISHNVDAETNYANWLRRKQSLRYIFEQQVRQLIQDNQQLSFQQLIEVNDNSHPRLIVAYFQNKINLETLVIIVDCIGCYSYWNNKMGDDVVWESVGLIISKYKRFVEYDKNQYRTLLKQLIS